MKNSALFFDFLQGGADVFAGNPRVMFQPVPAKQFAPFRRRRGDDGSQRRFVGNGEFQFPMRPAKRERRLGRVAGRILENIAAQNWNQFCLVKGFGAPTQRRAGKAGEMTDGERLRVAAVAPIGDEITNGTVPAPGLGGGAQVGQCVVMPANQGLPG